MFLPHMLRSLHQGYSPDIEADKIDQHDQHSVSTGIHVNQTRSQQSARAACNAVVSMTLCAVWRKQTSARNSRPIKIGQHPHDNWIT